MSIYFTLTAVLSDGDKARTQAPNADPFVVSAKLLRMSQTAGQRADVRPNLAAIFAPPTLVDAALSEVAECRSNGHATTSYFQINQTRWGKLSQSLLYMIHPFLDQNFVIHSIITVRNGQHDPSDILLLDLSHTPVTVVSELIDFANGETIHAGCSSVLKMILVSEVIFSSTTSINDIASESPTFDLPTCPVCLHRIDPLRLGLPKPRKQQMCSSFCPLPDYLAETSELPPCPRQQLLKPWPPPSHCVCCRTLREYWGTSRGPHLRNADDTDEELTQVFCYDCALRETLWVCMTCGYVGCGRYSNKHAATHFSESRHPFSLELATLRIWDYVGGEYVHRVDLLQCPCCVLSSNHHHAPASTAFASAASSSSKWNGDSSDGTFPASSPLDAGQDELLAYHQASSEWNSHPHQDEKSHKKASVISEEYEALLQSALEEQAQHYEGKLSRLLAALTAESVDASSISQEEQQMIDGLHSEIQQLRREIEVVGLDLLDAQAQEAGYRATSSRLLREQQVAEALLKKVQDETALEQQEGSRQMEELEQQIADLTANHRMRSQFSQDEELSQAQIFGTASSAEKTPRKKSVKKLLRRSKK